MNILNNNLKWYLFVKEVFYVFWKFIKKKSILYRGGVFKYWRMWYFVYKCVFFFRIKSDFDFLYWSLKLSCFIFVS